MPASRTRSRGAPVGPLIVFLGIAGIPGLASPRPDPVGGQEVSEPETPERDPQLERVAKEVFGGFRASGVHDFGDTLDVRRASALEMGRLWVGEIQPWRSAEVGLGEGLRSDLQRLAEEGHFAQQRMVRYDPGRGEILVCRENRARVAELTGKADVLDDGVLRALLVVEGMRALADLRFAWSADPDAPRGPDGCLRRRALVDGYGIHFGSLLCKELGWANDFERARELLELGDIDTPPQDPATPWPRNPRTSILRATLSELTEFTALERDRFYGGDYPAEEVEVLLADAFVVEDPKNFAMWVGASGDVGSRCVPTDGPKALAESFDDSWQVDSVEAEPLDILRGLTAILGTARGTGSDEAAEGLEEISVLCIRSKEDPGAVLVASMGRHRTAFDAARFVSTQRCVMELKDRRQRSGLGPGELLEASYVDHDEAGLQGVLVTKRQRFGEVETTVRGAVFWRGTLTVEVSRIGEGSSDEFLLNAVQIMLAAAVKP